MRTKVKETPHLVLLVAFWVKFSGVDHIPCGALLDEVLVDAIHGFIVHLGKGVSFRVFCDEAFLPPDRYSQFDSELETVNIDND